MTVNCMKSDHIQSNSPQGVYFQLMTVNYMKSDHIQSNSPQGEAHKCAIAHSC